MRFSLLFKTLRDKRNAVLGWGIGLGLYLGLMALFFPSMKSTFGDMEELLAKYPPAMKAFVGDFLNFGTIEGFLSVEFFSWIPLILAIFAIAEGSGALAGEEGEGTLELLLSNPIPRWRVVVEKFAATAVALVAVVLMVFLIGLVSFLSLGIAISYSRLLQTLLATLPLLLAMASFSLLGSAFLPARRMAALAGAVVIIYSYLCDSLGKVVERIRFLRPYTLYHYYDVGEPFRKGLNWEHILILLGFALVCWVLAILAFERRDLATRG